MLTNIAVKYMLCIQKHQNESYMRHRRGIIGDSFKLQALVHQTNWNSAKRSTVPYMPCTPKHWDKLKQINSRKKSLLLNDVMTAKLAAETQQTFSLLQIRREGSNGQNVFTCVLQSVRSDMARWSDSFFPIIYQRKGEPFTGHIKWSWLMPSRCKRWWRHQTNWNSAKRSTVPYMPSTPKHCDCGFQRVLKGSCNRIARRQGKLWKAASNIDIAMSGSRDWHIYYILAQTHCPDRVPFPLASSLIF